jgi:hypothetical protein
MTVGETAGIFKDSKKKELIFIPAASSGAF